MKIIRLLLIAILIPALTSCLGGDNTITSTRSLQSATCFNYIVDNTTGDSHINAAGATYTLEMDFSNMIANITVTGLQLTPGGASYSFNIPQQKFSFDAMGALIISVPSYIDTGNNVTINGFKLSFLDRMAGQSWIPVWSISYEIDSKYSVRTVQNSIYYFGESKVDTSAGKEYTTVSPYYCIAFDPRSLKGTTMTGRFYLFNAQFASNMPKMNMAIRDITFDFRNNGFIANHDNLDIYVDDTTIQPDYKVTDFSLSATYDQNVFGTTISPCCNVEFTVAGRFNTNLSLGYNIPSDIND